jgi:hypothetical protein
VHFLTSELIEMCSQLEISGALLNERIWYASDWKLYGHRVDLDVVAGRNVRTSYRIRTTFLYTVVGP